MAILQQTNGTKPFKRIWVYCPICEEPDMPCVWWSADDGPYINCLNVSCPSNKVELSNASSQAS